MLLEHHLPGAQDPDLSGLEFDDLEAAANCKTPRAQLSALKAVGGGLRLSIIPTAR